jgi:prevent-host-death family protein
MKMAPLADVKSKFSAYLKESETDPVVVTRKGRPVAVILSVANDDELFDLLIAHSRRLKTVLDDSWQQIVRGEGIPHEQFWHEVDAETAANS